MKELIKSIKPKKMKAGELAELIADNQTELIDFYIKEAHRAKNVELIQELFTKMKSEKFVKALNKIIKSSKKDEDSKLDCGFVVIIAGLIEKCHKDDDMTDEIIAEYTDIIGKLLKDRVKKVNKKINIDPSVVQELLLITPDVGYISNDKFVGVYSQKMLRKLYYMSANTDTGITSVETVQALFSKLFGKKLLDLIAINILLEKKENLKNFNDKQTTMWNLMTEFALTFIENENKDHMTELLEYYCLRRQRDEKNGRNSARRLNLSDYNDEAYPKFSKAIKKFKKNEKERTTKFL